MSERWGDSQRDRDALDAWITREDTSVRCQWWALCMNEATDTEDHPILGSVPICARCIEKIAKIQADYDSALGEGRN